MQQRLTAVDNFSQTGSSALHTKVVRALPCVPRPKHAHGTEESSHHLLHSSRLSHLDITEAARVKYLGRERAS